FFFFFSSRRRHTRWPRDWSSDVCSSDLVDDSPPTLDTATAGMAADGSGVEQIDLNFTEDVNGLDPAQFRISSTANPTPTPIAEATLSGEGRFWTLSNLAAAINATGTYTLTYADGSGVTEAAGRAMPGLSFRF